MRQQKEVTIYHEPRECSYTPVDKSGVNALHCSPTSPGRSTHVYTVGGEPGRRWWGKVAQQAVGKSGAGEHRTGGITRRPAQNNRRSGGGRFAAYPNGRQLWKVPPGGGGRGGGVGGRQVVS